MSINDLEIYTMKFLYHSKKNELILLVHNKSGNGSWLHVEEVYKIFMNYFVDEFKSIRSRENLYFIK